MNGRIQWYIAHRHEVLRHNDQFLTQIDVSQLPIIWTETKKRWIKYLYIVRGFDKT